MNPPISGSRVTHDVLGVLTSACQIVGLDPDHAELIRRGENSTFRLRGQQVVVRVARADAGAGATAAKELQVARWLASEGLPAIEPLAGITQPLEVDGRTVTFWSELGALEYGGYPEIARTLRRLHSLPVPSHIPLEPLAPFDQVSDRISAAVTLPERDRAWLHDRLCELEGRYRAERPGRLPECVVHGDASAGNIVRCGGRTVLLDLERVSVGPPEWDLVSTAIDHTTFGILSAAGYEEFCRRYGTDVTASEGFELLRDTRELRITCWIAQHAAANPGAQDEAERRVACLRGLRGPRPWEWTALF